MLQDSTLLEVSTQRLHYDETPVEAGPTWHLPLTDLYLDAPDTRAHIYNPEEVRFPFSNDACTASYFEQLAVRTETPEFKNAQNRVAILVGESGLAANLKYIPEETIILLDVSKDMNIFMDEYVKSLRNAAGPEEWYGLLKIWGPQDIWGYMGLQVDKWHNDNREHPLLDEETFREAQKIARQKTIITWNADITDRPAIARLGQALKDRQAVVTMLNLTNVLPYVGEFRSPLECAEYLHGLPVTPNAPIITTSIGSRSRKLLDALARGSTGKTVTGPFFGLDNLSRATSPDSDHELGAIAERPISSDEAESQLRENDLLLDLLRKIILEDGEVIRSEGGILINIRPLSPLPTNERPTRSKFWKRKQSQ